MKSFKEFVNEVEIRTLQQQLRDAESPEEIERLTKLINTKTGGNFEENK